MDRKKREDGSISECRQLVTGYAHDEMRGRSFDQGEETVAHIVLL